MQTTYRDHMRRINRFKSKMQNLCKQFNVIERHDEITIYGYPCKFRVLDIYHNGEVDVFPINPKNPQIFEGRQRASLMYAKLYKNFFKNPDTYRDPYNDKGFRTVGDCIINIHDGQLIKKYLEPSMISLPLVTPRKKRLAKPEVKKLCK